MQKNRSSFYMQKTDLHIDITGSMISLKKNPLERGREFDTVSRDTLFRNQFDFIKAAEVNLVRVMAAFFLPQLADGRLDLSDMDGQRASLQHHNTLLESVKGQISSTHIQLKKHIEGLYFINGGSLEDDFDLIVKTGVRSIGIMWNNDSTLGCGNKTENDTGLTPLGKVFIKKMINAGMVVDLAHMSYKTFFDTLELIPDGHPCMFSHGNVDSVRHHHRNLKDDQIVALHNRGGIFGLSLVGTFIGGNHMQQWVEHLDYVLHLLGSHATVALGTDFDGSMGEDLIKDVEDVAGLGNLEHFLLQKYSPALVQDFFFTNASALFGE